MQPEELQTRLSGMMSFPVTPFDSDGEVDVPRLASHVEYQLGTTAAALFVACGTGEMFSLAPDEFRVVVEESAKLVDGRKPVVAGVGYGVAIAVLMAREAERAGADGLLVLPPYLVKGGQEGLYRYYEQIASSTRLGLIIYQRDQVRLEPETLERLAEIPNVVAFKDGLGDVDLITRLRVTCGDQLQFMNGLPTAELSVHAYRAAGVSSYSSAVLNFVPEIATAFYDGVERGDTESTDELLREFFTPFINLRDQVPGYAVALVKAGVGMLHGPVGDPRPPLVGPPTEHLQDLQAIIDRGRACL